MTPLDADIAWRRRRIEETVSAITAVEAEPESPSRTAELQVLTESLGRHVMTLHLLEETRSTLYAKT